MSNAEAQASSNALLHGLRELGWIEGCNLEVEYRFAGAGTEDLRIKALELAALQIDVIIARATPAVIALATATKKIPIVFTVVNDPVGSGFVESWARPGGNITGFANFEPSIAGKWLEVLKEIAPDVTRVAYPLSSFASFVRSAISRNTSGSSRKSRGRRILGSTVLRRWKNCWAPNRRTKRSRYRPNTPRPRMRVM
jgi:ABC-type uncharacterized transport system substrate-binding protein